MSCITELKEVFEMTGILINDDVLRASKIKCVSKNATIELDASHKLVYSYMHSKYCYMKSTNQEYFESQESIAKECGLSLRTVSTKVKELKNIGVIVVTKDKCASCYQKNVYVVNDMWGSKFILTDADGLMLNKSIPKQTQMSVEDNEQRPY
jgi:hypothetical protein